MKHLVQALVQHLMGSLEATLGDGPGFGATLGARPGFGTFYVFFPRFPPNSRLPNLVLEHFTSFSCAFPQTSGFRTWFWNILRLFSALSPRLPDSGPGFGTFHVFFPRFPPDSEQTLAIAGYILSINFIASTNLSCPLLFWYLKDIPLFHMW